MARAPGSDVRPAPQSSDHEGATSTRPWASSCVLAPNGTHRPGRRAVLPGRGAAVHGESVLGQAREIGAQILGRDAVVPPARLRNTGPPGARCRPRTGSGRTRPRPRRATRSSPARSGRRCRSTCSPGAGSPRSAGGTRYERWASRPCRNRTRSGCAGGTPRPPRAEARAPRASPPSPPGSRRAPGRGPRPRRRTRSAGRGASPCSAQRRMADAHRGAEAGVNASKSTVRSRLRPLTGSSRRTRPASWRSEGTSAAAGHGLRELGVELVEPAPSRARPA